MGVAKRQAIASPLLAENAVPQVASTLQTGKCGGAVPVKPPTRTASKRRRSKSDGEPQAQKAKPHSSKLELYPHEWVGCSPQETFHSHNHLAEAYSMRKAYKEHAEKLKQALEKLVAKSEKEKAEKEKRRQKRHQRAVDQCKSESERWKQEHRRRFLQYQQTLRLQQEQEQRQQQAEHQNYLLRCQRNNEVPQSQPCLTEYEWRQKKMEECQQW